MQRIGIITLAIGLVITSGCNLCLCGKRAGEQHCPTDVRKGHFWCFGEDAVFHGPCGPDEEFYGHEPTCWREWPASGSDWRDAHCGPPVVASIPYEEELLHIPSSVMPDAPPPTMQQNIIEDSEPTGTPPQEILTLPPMSSAEKKQMLPASYPTTAWPDTTAQFDIDGSESSPALEAETDAAIQKSMMLEFQR